MPSATRKSATRKSLIFWLRHTGVCLLLPFFNGLLDVSGTTHCRVPGTSSFPAPARAAPAPAAAPFASFPANGRLPASQGRGRSRDRSRKPPIRRTSRSRPFQAQPWRRRGRGGGVAGVGLSFHEGNPGSVNEHRSNSDETDEARSRGFTRASLQPRPPCRISHQHMRTVVQDSLDNPGPASKMARSASGLSEPSAAHSRHPAGYIQNR